MVVNVHVKVSMLSQKWITSEGHHTEVLFLKMKTNRRHIRRDYDAIRRNDQPDEQENIPVYRLSLLNEVASLL